MKKGHVTPMGNDQYTVDSYRSSHDSVDTYQVDMSKEDFGCSCANWDYRLRPLWEQMKKTGLSHNEAVYCKHIKEVAEYRKDWELIDSNAEAMIGEICTFDMNDRRVAGTITECSPIVNGLRPDFSLVVKGRSGKEASVKYIKNQVILACNWSEADSLLTQS